MKDINKILAKTCFKCKYHKKMMLVTTHKAFTETYLCNALGMVTVIPLLLPHVLRGRSKVSLAFACVVSPV